jgi:3-oxoacyl-[acyl-carrier-protein] synthase II
VASACTSATLAIGQAMELIQLGRQQTVLTGGSEELFEGTATDRGDVAESHATAAVLGARVPVSSMKNYVGHTLGACGALESWWAIRMMREGWFAPTNNLTDVDPECAELDYVTGEGRQLSTDCVMNNNFAFGGINTSLIFRACD